MYLHYTSRDELLLAVEQGRYSPAEAERLHRDLEDAEAVVRAWGSPFCDGWERRAPVFAWKTRRVATFQTFHGTPPASVNITTVMSSLL